MPKKEDKNISGSKQGAQITILISLLMFGVQFVLGGLIGATLATLGMVGFLIGIVNLVSANKKDKK